MNKSRNSQEYEVGLERFLDFAFGASRRKGLILCPCKECKLIESVNREVAREHLTVIGFIKGYNQWAPHGEAPSSTTTLFVQSFFSHLLDLFLNSATVVLDMSYTKFFLNYPPNIRCNH